ncbi:MAG TPA: flagellar basal body rod protein FlgB [bacterium]|nr:flagellar basal body rod protein FlgB [bacterium]
MINDPLINILGHRLAESAVHQRVIAHNLANAETPHFKAFRVIFEGARARQAAAGGGLDLARTHPGHVARGIRAGAAAATPDGIRLVRNRATTLRNDGNNVDVDRELADLSANTLYYGALSTFARKRFEGYRSIITAGR